MTRPTPTRTAGRRRLAVAAAVGVALLASACGSGSADDEGSADLGDATSEVGQQAAELVTATMGKFSYAENDFPESPSDIQPYTDWKGPTEAPAPAKSANVQVIVCTKAAAACMATASGIEAAGEALGWEVEVIDGGGTPQAQSQAFDTAFSRKPDAIIGVAVPTLSSQDKLEDAKERGIITIATGDTEPDSGTAYDAYVSFRMPLMETLVAYAEIARTDGKADTIVVNDPTTPSLIESMEQFKAVYATCDDCETSDVDWKITDAIDPTKVNSIISGALAANPDATSITLPYSIGLPAVIQAIDAASKADQVKILVKDADAAGLEALKAGQIEFNAGASPTWAGWGTVDQVIRGMAGEPYLQGDQTGLGVVTFDKSTVPDNTDVDQWDGLVDFVSEYKKIWGVS